MVQCHNRELQEARLDMIAEKLERINDRLFPRRIWHAPHWLVLGVNNVCNLHCRMCDVGTETINTNFAQNLIGMLAELWRRRAHSYVAESVR